MKKLITILLMVSFYQSDAQKLEYSRIVDTILTVEVTSPTSLAQNILGDFISPPSGKVWKVNSISIARVRQGDYIKYCSSLSTFSSSGMSTGVLFSDGANEMTLSTEDFISFADPNDQRYINNNQSANMSMGTNFPIWLNSSSKLTAFIYFNSNYGSNSFQNYGDICIQNTTGLVKVNAIEFNEN